mmetsp:Transcript_98768/g.247560  ORF Transcript_98768/g.247560 Transcript_98768/m.247560 type:complete len:247 (+) Transcript_98768:1273-2013(+)
MLLHLRAPLEVAPQASGELHGDIVLAEVPTELCVLHLLAPRNFSEVRHRLCDAAHKSGECDHTHDDYDDVEGPLHCIPWGDLHRSRSKLRNAPMQARTVSVSHSVVTLDKILRHPTRRPTRRTLIVSMHRADRIPETSNEVVHYDDDRQSFTNVEQCQHILRVDTLQQLTEESVQLQQAQQAGEAEEFEDSSGTQHCTKAIRVLGIRNRVLVDLNGDQHPIQQYEHQVRDEPCSEVMPCNLGKPHL